MTSNVIGKNDDDTVRVVKRYHYVFTENGLEQTSEDPGGSTKLIRVIIDIPDSVYRTIAALSKERNTPIETIMCEWITSRIAQEIAPETAADLK